MEFSTMIAELWDGYKNSVGPIVGLFNLAGAMLTAAVLIYTARAANAARNSTKVAQSALTHTESNARRDEFTRHFSLLLEQHNTQLDTVKAYLDGADGSALLMQLNGTIGHFEAFNKLSGHSVISPYMRVLYHLLKFVDKDFYKDDAGIEGKRKYTSLVRSLIRNDILYLIAVNASYVFENNVENQYAGYQRLLNKFNFFEHALFLNVTTKNEFSGSEKLKKLYDEIKFALTDKFNYILRKDKDSYRDINEIRFPLPLIISCIFDNPLREQSIKNLKEAPIDVLIIFSQVKDFYTIINKKEFGYYFSKFQDCHILNLDHDFDINRNNNITQKNLDSYPKISNDYILKSLEILKKENNLDTQNNYYCKIYNEKKSVIYNSNDFENTCREYLSWVQHFSDIEDGKYQSEIDSEAARWTSYSEATFSQRVV
ncbi:putative phage abortive infection protein [Pectobacterium peruviense]|uniref:putative phage abortive infection protein n=1 Tax=Pectobacterium peruviense TaxID=2066479 RepID=UPI000DE20C87|nr:putative phage abortive infection protein [Pectobacterium peruviense]